MKIDYVANVRMPTEKAHGIQIIHACGALIRAGADVELIVPDRRTPITESPFSYYGATTEFPILRAFTLDTVRLGTIGFFLQSVTFAIAARLLLRPGALVYSRDEIVLATLALLGVRAFIWESHDGSWSALARFVARRARGIVVVSEGAREFYVGKGISEDKILAVPNGVDLAAFARALPQDEARRTCDIPEGKPVALYAGRLDGWKGSATLFAAARLLPDIEFVVAGGEEAQVAALKKQHPSVRFLGYRPYRDLPDLVSAADVLILPNTAEHAVSLRFTSPLKLLAYLAAGKPIVASDLPSVREVAGEAALLVPADDPSALASGIQQVLEDPELARTLSNAARERAAGYGWDARAKRVLSFLSAVYS